MISIYTDYKLERYQKEIKYSFNFIFHTLGYSHRYIDDIQKLRESDILLIYGLLAPTAEELKQISRHYITVFIQADPNLYDPKGYSIEKIRRSIRETKLLTLTPVISELKFTYPAENYSEKKIHGGKINFDLAGNVFFHLSEFESQIDPQRDQYQCFPDEARLFYQWRETPIVHNLLWLIDNMLMEHSKAKKQIIARKCLYPEHQIMAAILTHSVDDLQKWSFNSLLLSVVDDFIMLFTLKIMQLFRSIAGKLKYLFTNYEVYWNFVEYLDLEQQFNSRSTFFVAAEENADIDYTLEDTDLQEDIGKIKAAGSEIGLLATNDKPNREDYITRKQILSHNIGTQSIGIRQFDFRIHDQIRELLQQVRPAYSNSLCYQSMPGFKNGVAIPYQPWFGGTISSHYEIPLSFRDIYLRLTRNRIVSLEDAKVQFKKIYQAVRKVHGVLCLDFTLANYAEIHYCGKLYQYILALLNSENIYKATCMELADWWKKRERVTIEESDYELSVFFPDELDHFCLTVSSEFQIAETSGVEVDIQGNLFRFSGIKKGTIALIRFSPPD